MLKFSGFADLTSCLEVKRSDTSLGAEVTSRRKLEDHRDYEHLKFSAAMRTLLNWIECGFSSGRLYAGML